MIKIFVPLAMTILPVLLPLNSVHQKNKQSGMQGLDRLSWANIDVIHNDYYWGHLILALVGISWICYVIYVEFSNYARIRQGYLTSARNSTQAMSKTILITNIPKQLLSFHELFQLYDTLPGGVHKIWVNRDCSILIEMIQEREKIVQNLEIAETKLIKKIVVNHARITNNKKHFFRKTLSIPHDLRYQDLRNLCLDQRYRESIRLPMLGLKWIPSLPFLGKKVDVIDYNRESLSQLNREIQRMQMNRSECPLGNSAFIQFNSQLTAHIASQSIVYYSPLCMISHVGVVPRNVIWENLQIKW